MGKKKGDTTTVMDQIELVRKKRGGILRLRSTIVLVNQLIDDSGSIESAGNTEPIIEGFNLSLAELEQSRRDDIFTSAHFMTDGSIFRARPPRMATRLSRDNFRPQHMTPLYDSTMLVLRESIEYANSCAQECRTFTMIYSDGEDTSSKRNRAKDVKAVVDEMFATENHIVAATGFWNGNTDFYRVFEAMGIPRRFIQCPGREPQQTSRSFTHTSHTVVMGTRSDEDWEKTQTMGLHTDDSDRGSDRTPTPSTH
ncbi:hypothetical protein ACFL2D_00050 [Patescibacteria group bacterium]